MNISPVGSGPIAAVAHAAAKDNTQQPKETVAAAPSDTVRLGDEHGLPPVYTRDNAALVRMRTESDLQSQLLRRMIEKMITEQYEAGNHLFQLLYGDRAIQIDPTLRSAVTTLPRAEQVDEPTRAQAEAMVGEEGFYGVAHTSARIVDYARAIGGGDPAKIDTLRGAVEQAFTDVRKTLGGQLPDITQETHTAVMAGFDSWKAQSAAPAAAKDA